jgi:hypothetical protein
LNPANVVALAIFAELAATVEAFLPLYESLLRFFCSAPPTLQLWVPRIEFHLRNLELLIEVLHQLECTSAVATHVHITIPNLFEEDLDVPTINLDDSEGYDTDATL